MLSMVKLLQIKRLLLTCGLILVSAFGMALWAQHDHDHSGHDHSGHNHAQHDDHSGHNHAQQDNHAGHDHSGHDHSGHNHGGGNAHAAQGGNGGGNHGHGPNACGHAHDATVFDPGGTAFHHIADANVYSIGPFSIPLPCILYAPKHEGWSFFLSSEFHIHGAHGDGSHSVGSYVLNGGTVMRVKDGQGFPSTQGHIQLAKDPHDHIFSYNDDDGKAYMAFNGQCFELERKSTADFGLFGGGITSYYDFSLTKNVVAMLLVALFLIFIFFRVASAYREREGQAPNGLQGFIEPMFVFIQDEVAKPFLGHHWERYLPFLMAIFFFILGLNLFGQVPFFGGTNATGNLALTMALAVITAIVVNLSGNKHYWEHIFWMPGVPAWVKTILTPVEFLGVFIKPLTLMLRLFANITAGHMVMVIFVGLIFVFGGTQGDNPAASLGAAAASTVLALFMMAIELLVAFLQAFVFTILTASYLGAATEEAHH